MKNQVKLLSILEFMPEAVRLAVTKDGVDENTVMLRRAVAMDVKAAGKNAKRFTVYLSTRHLDHDRDVVTPSGWDTQFYDQNPVGIWSHNLRLPPIFKALSTWTDSVGLLQEIEFAETERGEDFRQLVAGGFLKTFSAGFRADTAILSGAPEFAVLVEQFRKDWSEFGDREAAECRRIVAAKTLFESTLCNLPSNPYAMVQAIHKGSVRVSEDTKKDLSVEAFIQKAVDAAVLDPSFARGPAPKPTDKTADEPPAKTDDKTQAPPPKDPPPKAATLKVAEVEPTAPAMVALKVARVLTAEDVDDGARRAVLKVRGGV